MASEPRPARVPRPSQKVRAVAAPTKPTTKKTKKRTSKEVSKAPKRRRVVLPVVSEVIDLADDEATQAPALALEVTMDAAAEATDEDLLRSASENEDEVVSQEIEYKAL